MKDEKKLMITSGNPEGHGFNSGDVVEVRTLDRRRWKRLWYFVTFRQPPTKTEIFRIASATVTTMQF